MEITFEVTLDYGEEGPGDGEPSPTEADIAEAVATGLSERGFPSVNVKAVRV